MLKKTSTASGMEMGVIGLHVMMKRVSKVVAVKLGLYGVMHHGLDVGRKQKHEIKQWK